jgi:cytochrome c
MAGAATACVLALTASLLLARVHPFGDPDLNGAGVRQPVLAGSAAPADVRATLEAKCVDCHSAATRLPVYDRIAARLAPASWLMERDVVEGRRHLDLSAWDRYTPDQQQVLLAKMVAETKQGRMPLVQYRLIHWNASVNEGDVQAFTRWMQASEAMQSGSTCGMGGEGDPDRGREVFEKRCTGCHALDRNREGPRLGDVYGRIAGTVAGFPYSNELLKAHVVWNEALLEQWLTDPDGLVPGNNMDFHVPNPQERKDLVSYLRKLSTR